MDAFNRFSLALPSLPLDTFGFLQPRFWHIALVGSFKSSSITSQYGVVILIESLKLILIGETFLFGINSPLGLISIKLLNIIAL